jgi:subtilisin-like proprotein convertase family protein
VSGIQGIVSVGLSFLVFHKYGLKLSIRAYENDESDENKIHYYTYNDKDGKKSGIMSVILIISLAEMFCGLWLI